MKISTPNLHISSRFSFIGHHPYCKFLCRQLLDEATRRHNPKHKGHPWKTEIDMTHPQQVNSSDCGVFALVSAYYFIYGLTTDYTAEHMNYYRRKLAWDLRTERVNLFDAPVEVDPVRRMVNEEIARRRGALIAAFGMLASFYSIRYSCIYRYADDKLSPSRRNAKSSTRVLSA